MTGEPLLILVDYRGAFWSSTRNVSYFSSLDVERIREALVGLGHPVEVLEFAELDLTRTDLAGKYVIYTSSEDDGAFYKRFIEGKVVGLEMLGAHPIPRLELLLAHHDKATMESVRHALLGSTAGQPTSQAFGTFEEYRSLEHLLPSEAVVLKPTHGAGSRGVRLVGNHESSLRAVRRLMRSSTLVETVLELVRRLRRRNYVPRSLHRKAVVVQQYLPGLRGDYKVLRYGERYYALARDNRPGDFRASGSGRLDYAPHLTTDMVPVLDAAKAWSDALGSPYCSLDIAYDPSVGVEPHLLEFQCVMFGPATAENSTGFFHLTDDGWARADEVCDLERVFAEATSSYIASHAALGSGS
jgi:hypothetical protein